jgi:hypothetical protein
MPVPPFGALKRAWRNEHGDAIVRDNMEAIERWASTIERQHPGVDWLPILCDGLYLAAYTFRPDSGPWWPWLELHLRGRIARHAKTRLRRLSKLTPHPIEAVDEWVRHLL